MLITISDPDLNEIYKLVRAVPTSGELGQLRRNKMFCELFSQLVHVDQHAVRMLLPEVLVDEWRVISSSLLALVSLDPRDIEVARRDIAALGTQLDGFDRASFEVQLTRLTKGEEAFRALLDVLYQDDEEQKAFMANSLEVRPEPSWREPRMTVAEHAKRYRRRLERFESHLAFASQTPNLAEMNSILLVNDCAMLANIGYLEDAERCLAKIKTDISHLMDTFRVGVVQGLIVRRKLAEAKALAASISDPECRVSALIALYIERKRAD